MDVTVQISGKRGSGRSTLANHLATLLRSLGAKCIFYPVDSNWNESFNVIADKDFLAPTSSQVDTGSSLASSSFDVHGYVDGAELTTTTKHPSQLLAKHSDKPMPESFHQQPNPEALAKFSYTPKVSTALSRAHDIIYGEREQTYGDPSKNLRTIAAYWSTHLNASYGKNLCLTTDDVCVMMILLKQARQANTPGHQDSIDDTIGYAALQDRVNSNKKLEAESPVARAFKNHEY